MLLLLKAKITNDVLFNAMAGLETSSDDESDAELVAVTLANESSAKHGSSKNDSTYDDERTPHIQSLFCQKD